MHACRQSPQAPVGGLKLHFLRTTEIGGSQETRLRAPTHAVRHASERISTIMHARRMVHATIHAHGHAACDPIPAAGRVNGHVFFGEERFEERPQGAIMYLKTMYYARLASPPSGSAATAASRRAQKRPCCTEVTITKRTKSKREGDNNTQSS